MKQNGNEITISDDEAKVCKICNKTFDSSKKMIWHVRKTHQLDLEHYIVQTYYHGNRPVCLKTGKPLTFKAHKLGPWFKNFSQNNFPRKPHTEESKQKIKVGCEKTTMKKFGVKNVFTSEWCKKKIKKSMLEKYGVDNIMKLTEMREWFSHIEKDPKSIAKSSETSLIKFGEKHYSKTSKHKLNIRKKGFLRYYKNWQGYLDCLRENKQDKVHCLSSEADIDNDIPLKFECKFCHHKWDELYVSMPDCPKCRESFANARSIEESNLMKWLKEATTKPFAVNKRFKVGKKTYEADICFPQEKIIIELNGLYWHGEKSGKNRKYHIDKLNALESIGYSVFQIFEDEWLFKTDMIKGKILHKLRLNSTLKTVNARQCEVKCIVNKEANEFLNQTHIQGATNALYCYGAYYNDKLIAVMTFANLRIIMGNKNKDKNSYELVRFSTANDCRVTGIFGRLIKLFIRDRHPRLIVSYADKRWSQRTNNLYEKTGFTLVKETQPNYWYVKKYTREHRFGFTKQKLVALGHDSKKSEWDIMQSLGYDRIWDCGHFRYEMKF